MIVEAFHRIKEIDKMFEEAIGWGSWMIMCANEREDLVNKLNREFGHNLKHKYQARCNGRRTD